MDIFFFFLKGSYYINKPINKYNQMVTSRLSIFLI